MKRKILIVDDKPGNLLALEKVLASLDAEIVTARNGEEALRACLNEDFALAILDVQMPGMDGYELAGYLRGDARTSLIPIIFLSAVFSDDMHVNMGYEAGAVDFLTKPFRPELLLAKARFFLEFDRQRAELAASKNALESLVRAQSETNERLRQEVEGRARAQEELEAAMEAAQAANKAKGFFLANMSHELRTPMNGVVGMLQLLATTNLSREQNEFVEIAKASAMSLVRILSDILDLSSIEAGKMELRDEPFNPLDVMESVVQALSVEARNKAIDIRLSPSPTLPGTLIGDAGRIRQILVNLVGNAIKFTTRGEVSLKAGHLSGPDGGTALLVAVTDTGIGIPRDKLDSIFEPFTQVDDSYSRKRGGVGLGLGIVKRLVDGMGGDITVSSVLGQGTTMEVCLPVNLPPRATQDAAAKEAGQTAGPLGLHILVAEDDEVSRMATLKFLRILGCSAEAVEDGDQVLQALAKARFDVVLMDVSMQRMDGPDAAQAVRSSRAPGVDPSIPIVAITAHAMKGDREHFLDQGMDDYITKPLLLDQIRATLERVLLAKTGQDRAAS